MDKLYDVIIAGAGPVGLFLACELSLAGTSVLVLERDDDPHNPWKVAPLGRRGLNTPTLESLYRRGLLDEVLPTGQRPGAFVSANQKPGYKPAGHFAGIMLDASKLDLTRWKYKIGGPSLRIGPTTLDQITSVLSKRAESQGVEILRGHGVEGVDADDNGVTVDAEGGRKLRGRWLVGCDGGRSAVRKAAGIEFIGTEAKFTGYAVHCEWDHPERIQLGFHPEGQGMYIHAGTDALFMMDFDDGAFDRSQEITKQHVQEVFERMSGIKDLKISKIHLASAFTDRCKQATTYRKGRIMLAGDAAHIHGPVGSQGLNLGLGDAMNLGWKLAATIRKEKAGIQSSTVDMTLLDSYEKERRPIGEWVLEHTRAQTAVLQPDAYGRAGQNIMRDIIDTVDGANLLIGRHWGLSQRYILGDSQAEEHPLVGCSAPDFEFEDGTRQGSKQRTGRGILVELKGDDSFKTLLNSENSQSVDYLSLAAKDARGLKLVLIRPDGIVACVMEEGEAAVVTSFETALKRWFA